MVIPKPSAATLAPYSHFRRHFGPPLVVRRKTGATCMNIKGPPQGNVQEAGPGPDTLALFPHQILTRQIKQSYDPDNPNKGFTPESSSLLTLEALH